MSVDDVEVQSGSIVATRDVSVRYGRKLAVDRVSLQIEPGSVYALLGRNGAGKSSLLRVLLGLRPCDQGTAEVLGLEPWKERRRLMERVGVVPEQPDLPPALSCRAIADLCARLEPTFDRAQFDHRLSRLDIDASTVSAGLSRGQKTEVQLALALARRPELLILDDPTLGLDAVARRSVFAELIDELAQRSCSILLTTHDLEGVEGLATHVGVLRQGRLLFSSSLDDLQTRFRRLTLRAVGERGELEGVRVWNERETPFGREIVVELPQPGAFTSPATRSIADATPVPFAPEPMSLEEIFVAVAAAPGEVEPGEKQEASHQKTA